MEVGVQVRCYQWRSREFLIPLPLLKKVCQSRRASKTLAKLLPLFEDEPKIKITYDELAKHLGYDNRSGSYKAIKLLESLGVVAVKDGYLRLTMGDLLLKAYDD